MYSFMWKSLAFADKCAMKLTCQVWNVSTQDTHNLTINSPCQNVSYELLQCDHITPTPVHKLTFGCPKQLDREPQPHNQFKSNWEMLSSQNAIWFHSLCFIQLIVGGLCWSVNRCDDCYKTRLHTQCLSLLHTHALTQTHTLDPCTARSINPVECAPAAEAEECYFWAEAPLCSQATNMQRQTYWKHTQCTQKTKQNKKTHTNVSHI